MHTILGDDMQNSIWTQSAALPEFPRLEHDLKTDVLIIGGGLAGILCAYHLAQNGFDYALIEADKIMGGVSGNTTAKITSQHGLIYGKLIREFDKDTARLYWEANEAALRQYQDLAQSIDCDFEEKDSYIYSLDCPSALEAELSALEQMHISAQWTEPSDLPFQTVGAIRFPNQAQFHPLKFVSRIVKGMNIFENTTAREFVGNTVLTDRGKITAKKIIVATHFPFLNKHGSYFLKLYQERSYVLALENAADVKGMYLDEAKGGLSLRNYENLLLLGGDSHRTGKPGDGWAGLERVAKTYYPNTKVVARWATQDCISLDGIPYIGQYSPRTPNLLVATGFNKWGMTSSMVAAMVLCDLVQGRKNAYAEIFSPARTIVRKQLFINGLETTKNLLKLTKPRCPHLGCTLQWNRQERSWDCPCHGSRFTAEGELLDNPATANMKKHRSH